MKLIRNCKKCDLCNNQLPLLDNKESATIMWVGLSAKKVDNVLEGVPLNNDTNSGKIIEQIEKQLIGQTFYKTNLVKCLPLNEKNKLRYPTNEEMKKCIQNLIEEIENINPKIIFLLGKKTYDFVIKHFSENNIDTKKIFYIEHPSYIYVYKRKNIDDYIHRVQEIVAKNR